jgi:hypothetical protein
MATARKRWSIAGLPALYVWHLVDVLRIGTERLFALTHDPGRGIRRARPRCVPGQVGRNHATLTTEHRPRKTVASDCRPARRRSVQPITGPSHGRGGCCCRRAEVERPQPSHPQLIIATAAAESILKTAALIDIKRRPAGQIRDPKWL